MIFSAGSSFMETASPPAQEQLAQLLRLCATSEPAVPRGKTKLQRGGKQNTVSAMYAKKMRMRCFLNLYPQGNRREASLGAHIFR